MSTVYTYRIVDQGLLDDDPRSFAYSTQTTAWTSVSEMVKAAAEDFKGSYEDSEWEIDLVKEMAYVLYRLYNVGVEEVETLHESDYDGPVKILYWSMGVK